MSLKLLDIQYLRAQQSGNGQVLVTGTSLGVEYTNDIVVRGGKVGIGSNLPSSKLTVVGNIELHETGSTLIFSDGSQQSTAAVTLPPSAPIGAVQFNAGGSFGGSDNLFWNSGSNRLGIGTSNPRSTLQIKDVGYESTDTTAATIDAVVLDSFPVPDYRSCHYIVQVTDTNYSWFHTTQIMVLHDGLNAFKSEYNIVTTQEKLGSFDVEIVSSNVLLTFTPFYSSDKNIKVIRTSIEP